MATFLGVEGGAGEIRPVSLSGIVGSKGFGRGINVTTVALADSTMVPILGSNPQRSWAIIQNPNASAITIYIGNITVPSFILAQYGTFQIDINAPWSGAVSAYQTSGGAVNIYVSEASVQ